MTPEFLSNLAASPWLPLGLASVLTASFGAVSALLINKANARADRAAKTTEELSAMLAALDSGQQWIAYINSDGTLEGASLAFCATCNLGDNSFKGQSLTKLLEPFTTEHAPIIKLQAAITSRQPTRLHLHLRNPVTQDEEAWLVTGRPWHYGDNQQGYWLLGQDITAEKNKESSLEALAYTDTHTGFGNRPWFANVLKESLQRRDARALFHVHFPRLHVLMNSLGTEQAELFMINVAARLKDSLTPYQTISRLSSSSFGVLEKHGAPGTMQDSAQELGHNLSKPFTLLNHEVQLIPAIGIAPYAETLEDTESWMIHAEMAAHSLHIRNKPMIGLYEPSQRVQLARARSMESDLRRAIYFCPEQLYPAYQPIYRLSDRKLVGMEMLARWQHPHHGNIPPLEFIPVAEESGLIAPLWVQLFAAANRQLLHWQKTLPDLFLSVNLSSRQFSLPGLLATVDTLCNVTGMSPSHIKLEITETEMMDDPDMAMEQMLALKARGFSLSIDDFGTGFSSLSYLHKLPISDVKIDRSFVKTMHENPANLEIVNMIARLGEKLGHTTTAEGIETEADLEVLDKLGCKLGQGFYFAKPLPANEFERLVQAG